MKDKSGQRVSTLQALHVRRMGLRGATLKRKKLTTNERWQLSRRDFFAAAAGSGFAAGINATTVFGQGSDPAEKPERIPLKIGLRAASMKMNGRFDIFKVAREIHGLTAIELQVADGHPNLWDLDAVRHYKNEAHRWGVSVPSLSGVWGRGPSQLRSAGVKLLRAIRAGKLLGSSVILVALLGKDAPDMNMESSYGPMVEVLQDVAPYAADAGITLGLENSLSPADSRKLVDMIDRPSIRIYYDTFGVARWGHVKEAVPGISLLGKDRICQAHLQSSGGTIASEKLVDFSEVIQAFNQIGYAGWYFFETRHTSQLQMMKDTEDNIAFVKRHSEMPWG
jgi:sugar phosphate isomerase/epimerase